MRFNNFKYDELQDEFTCKNNIKLKLFQTHKEKTATGFIRHIKQYHAQAGYQENDSIQ